MLIAGLMDAYVSGPEAEFLLIGPFNVGAGLMSAFVFGMGVAADWEWFHRSQTHGARMARSPSD